MVVVSLSPALEAIIDELRRNAISALAQSGILRCFGYAERGGDSGPCHRAPRQRHQRHVISVPLAYRFRPALLQRIFDWLSLADHDLQCENNHGDRKGPFVEAQIAQKIEQEGAREDN